MALSSFNEYDIAAHQASFPPPLGPRRVHYITTRVAPRVILFSMAELHNMILHYASPSPFKASMDVWRDALQKAHSLGRGEYKVGANPNLLHMLSALQP